MLCKNCNTEFSDDLNSCPQCGFSIRAQNGSGFQPLSASDVNGFNFGALCWGFLWAFFHRLWFWAVLCLIPFVGFAVSVFLGFKGNELAIRSRHFENLQQFKNVQKAWTRSAVFILVLIAVFSIIGFLLSMFAPYFMDKISWIHKEYWIDFFKHNTGIELFSALFIISFTESCCFIIPPDPFLPLLAANRTFSGLLIIWLVTTAASVIGAAFGYWIGIKGGRPLAQKWFAPDKIKKVEDLYNKYDALAVGIAAFTPIPYKVFTITGGVFRINFWKFIIVSIFGRGIRYFLWALLGWFFKEAANIVLHQIDKVMGIIILFLLVLFIAVFVNNVMKKIEPARI